MNLRSTVLFAPHSHLQVGVAMPSWVQISQIDKFKDNSDADHNAHHVSAQVGLILRYVWSSFGFICAFWM